MEVNDLNRIAAAGLVLGDEGYTIEELLAYRDQLLAHNNERNYRSDDRTYWGELIVPNNFLNLGNQNFLDLLIMVLSSPTVLDERAESARRDMLCTFITYAAPSYSPSFDYLQFVLGNVAEFRGGNIGAQAQNDTGIYRPFPTSCVLLVQAMATSHANLESVISSFATSGDISTAGWLISIKEQRG
ncbi:MAG: hypothetical protein WDN31_11975 [Hyphomicrobium sp.]